MKKKKKKKKNTNHQWLRIIKLQKENDGVPLKGYVAP